MSRAGVLAAIARAARRRPRRDGRRPVARARAAGGSTASGSSSTRAVRVQPAAPPADRSAAPGGWPGRAAARPRTGARRWRPRAASTTRFFAYGEDVDLALRLRAAGWQRRGGAARPAACTSAARRSASARRCQRRLAGFARGVPAAPLRRAALAGGAAGAASIEALVVAWGLVRFRTLVPLTRAGWRAGAPRARGRLPVPAGAVDERDRRSARRCGALRRAR